MNADTFKTRGRKALRSRTVWLGILVAALSAVQEFVLQEPLPAITQGVIGFFLSAVIIVLRFFTTDALDEK